MKTELYRHFNAKGELLYVGISLSTVARLVAHRHSSGWFDEIATIAVERFESRDDAESAEISAIKIEAPKFNRLHTNCTKADEAAGVSEVLEKLTKVVQVQVAADEHDTLRQAAERLSIGISTYMRMKTLEAAAPPHAGSFSDVIRSLRNTFRFC